MTRTAGETRRGSTQMSRIPGSPARRPNDAIFGREANPEGPHRRRMTLTVPMEIAGELRALGRVIAPLETAKAIARAERAQAKGHAGREATSGEGPRHARHQLARERRHRRKDDEEHRLTVAVNVGFWREADIPRTPSNVCYRRNSGHGPRTA